MEGDVIRLAAAVSAALALLVAAFFGGHQFGQTKERAHWQAKEITTLRQHAQETDRLMKLVAEKQKEYNDAQIQIADFAARLRGTDRLRVQAEHRARIERASAASLRTYAAGINDLYESCRAEYIELGLEAARTAAALEALNE